MASPEAAATARSRAVRSPIGVGDLTQDGYNLLLNGELGKKEAIYYRDRVGRGSVGVSAVGQPQWGFDPNAVSTTNNIPRNGGNGTIPVNNVTGVRVNNTVDRSIIGNVRNPSTLDYYSRSDPGGVGFTRTFPNAATYCAANANLPQNNVGGGCINDQWQQMGQIQPTQENGSFYGRLHEAGHAGYPGLRRGQRRVCQDECRSPGGYVKRQPTSPRTAPAIRGRRPV